MITQFRTIADRSEGFYKEKGSKFIGIALPVDDLDAVKYSLDEIRQQYYDARHHCYAYILGNDGSEFRVNDDGEPNHSAGDPILGQIKANNLTKTLVVVVRYFGGTKLGVSGLVNAYRTAASEALKNAGIKTEIITTKVRLDYAYETTNDVMRLINDFQLVIIDQKFETSCQAICEVSVKNIERLKQKVGLLKNTGSEIELTFTN